MSYEADIETVREFIAAKGSMRGYAPMVALDRLAAEHKRLRAGMRRIADNDLPRMRNEHGDWMERSEKLEAFACALLDDEGTA